MPTYVYFTQDPTTLPGVVTMTAADMLTGANTVADNQATQSGATGTSTWHLWGVDYASLGYADCTVTVSRQVTVMPRPIPPPTPK